MKNLFIYTLNYNELQSIAKKMRYKFIEDKYFHFVFNGMRIECLYDNIDFYMCIVKGCNSKSKMNDSSEFNKNIVFITDYKKFIINDEYFDYLNKFDIEFKKYYEKHMKEKT